MALSWWRNLLMRAQCTAKNARGIQRRPIPPKFRFALTVEQLEDRLAPAVGKANVFLNVGTVSAPAVTLAAAPSTIVPVFIDFDAVQNSSGSNGGLGAGTFYVLYDPAVLSINQVNPGAAGSDIKLGGLVAVGAGYTVQNATGFTVGAVGVGLSHSGSTYVTGNPSGHLIELDFHVVSSAAAGTTTLLDLQSDYTDPQGSFHLMNISDKLGAKYPIIPPPQQYGGAPDFAPLTQPGVLQPGDFGDIDPTDAAVQVVSSQNRLAPTANADVYSMAPNQVKNSVQVFPSTMTVTGQANGVLGNDMLTANGSMIAVLTSAGAVALPVSAESDAIVSATESGMVVTITTAAANTLQPGESVTIAGVGIPAYNGTFAVATVLSATQFTYNMTALGLRTDSSHTGTVSAATTTVFSANTAHGRVWLGAADGSFAYTPNVNFSGTDTFTYQAVDAASATASANATVTIYVGGILSMPQNLHPSGSQVVIPVNIFNPNPINSGALGNVTIGLNYDSHVFDPATIVINEGTVNTAAGWNAFTFNATTPGKIVITTSNSGGSHPITSTTGGSMALITFNVLGSPTGTSFVNLSAASPQVSDWDVFGDGTPVSLPMAFPAVDNFNFSGPPGADDGLVIFNSATTTTLSAAPVSPVTYGTKVTLTATVSTSSGSAATTLGSVDFKDVSGNIDLGLATAANMSGGSAIFQLITTPNQLQVLQANGGIHTITATYSGGAGFYSSAGTLSGGQVVKPALLTISAATNTKIYDAGTAATARPTVSGLVGNDTVTGLAEVYADANAGTVKTLSVSAYTVNDGNGGNDYTVKTIKNTTGAINPLPISNFVAALAPTPTGFTTTFTKPFNPTDLTLYSLDKFTPQDVILRGTKSGPIHGSLLFDPTNMGFTFHATTSYLLELNSVHGIVSALLPDDTYSVTLLAGAGANGFAAALEGGNAAGSAGASNFTTSFTTSYQHTAAPVLDIPDFARGPDSGSPIKLPNDSAYGIPITLYKATGVTDVTFTLNYNPVLLNISGTLQGTGSDATDPAATFTLVSNAGGVATFTYHDDNPKSGKMVLGDIQATVPDSAANLYQVKEVLQFGNIVINHGAITGAIGLGGLHVNAYLGDLNGDGIINGLDTLTANLVAIGSATGSSAFQQVDPVIVGDMAGDLSVDAGNVFIINLYVAKLDPTQLPVPPGFAVTSPNAADPTLDLVTRGLTPLGSPSVSVMIDHPHPEGSMGLTEAILGLTYDPIALSVSPADITLGSIPNQGTGWQITSVVDQTTGQIGIELYSLTPTTSTEAGSLVNIAFHVGEPNGVSRRVMSPVQLVNLATPNGNRFATEVADAQGAMILSPGQSKLEVPIDAEIFIGQQRNPDLRGEPTVFIGFLPLFNTLLYQNSPAQLAVDRVFLALGRSSDAPGGLAWDTVSAPDLFGLASLASEQGSKHSTASPCLEGSAIDF